MSTTVGERIREARLAQDRSLADVAGKANVSVATLSRIENHKQSLDLELFLAIARVLQVPTEQLLRDSTAEDHDGDPLARRIAALGNRERMDLWRNLAVERRARLSTKRGAEMRHVGQHVEELLAQVDFLREELESIRKHVKRR